MNRSSGVLMHVSSLWGDYSCGSFGINAKEFIDFLSDCGFSYWQVLPMGLVDECNSPYKSYSSFAGNQWFIDLKVLFDKGLLTQRELKSAEQSTPYVCEYDRLRKERLPLLLKASERVKNRNEIEKYILENEYLYKFCVFMALKEANSYKPWNKWKKGSYNPDVFFMWEFIEYEFFAQWQDVKNYAIDKGIKIIGDIPFYVSYDSSDVWSDKKLFSIDKENNPCGVAGVPPDYFSVDGQLWGNPLYNWEEMKKDGYRWWKDRVKHQLLMFDGVRIDHFRGIDSFWCVAGNAETARDGKWMKGPSESLINAIKSVAGNKLIIAEDLGDITPDVKRLLEYSGFPGMRVFQFAFLGENNLHMPHNYVKNCVAYSGTHDNNTLLGYLWELDDQSRKRCFEYCGADISDWNEGFEAIIKTLYRSSAELVILPIQDILRYGSDTRMNKPGTVNGNWQYRVTKEQIDSVDKQYFKKLNSTFYR